MAAPPDRPDRKVSIQLTVPATDPTLLTGLDHLYELGLISDERLRNLAREQLSCALPLGQAQTAEKAAERSQREPAMAAAASGSFITATNSRKAAAQAAAKAKAQKKAQKSQAKAAKPSALGTWLQSFMAEVSVLWLLFLGLFMVVISSAVLAASQWQNFSAVGQYLILLSYTLAFWGAGQWASRNPKLQLTAQMVQRVALLLVPINFWAVDGFGLWRSPLGWIVAVVVAIVLSFLLKQTLAPLVKTAAHPQRLLINVLALSWLHWGWSIGIMPLLASYVAMVGTAINLVYPDDEASGTVDAIATKRQSSLAGSSAQTTEKAAAAKTKQSNTLSIALVLLFGALLLLGRAVLAAGVPVAQLGLAIGICGAVLLWCERSETTRLPGRLWSWVGGLLMLLGWLVSLQQEPPLQSFAISLLGLLLLWDRLGRLRTSFDLTAFFLVGLQAIWLARRFAPPELRAALVEKISTVAGMEGMPFAVVGVTLFPYLLLFVVLGEVFHRSKQAKLSRQALFLSTALGFGLTLFSLGNPLMRALNLTLSAVTLGAMARRRKIGSTSAPPAKPTASASASRTEPATANPASSRRDKASPTPPAQPLKKTTGNGWIALLQLMTLGAIFSWSHVMVPELPLLGWSLLCLSCVALEWLISLGIPAGRAPAKPSQSSQIPTAWRHSAWVSGLLLAGLGYLLSCLDLLAHLFSSNAFSKAHLLWWFVPLGLLAMAEHPRCLYPKTTRVFSLIAIALIQPFGWLTTGTRLAGFGLATLLSGIHSRRWQQLPVVAIAVGWSIAFTIDLAQELWREDLGLEPGLVIWGAEVALLWFLWAGLRPQGRKLARLYAQATNGWAIILAIPLALGLLGALLDPGYGSFTSVSLANSCIMAATLPSLSLALGLWQSRSDGAAQGLGLFGGLTLASILARFDASPIHFALAFLALGWVLLLAGEFWLAKLPPSPQTLAQPTPKKSTPATKLASSPATSTAPTSKAKTGKASKVGGRPLELSCDSLPLVYAILGIFLGHLNFGQHTGIITLIGAFIALGVSRRRRQLSPLGYLGLITTSIGCFELLLYQLSQASGGNAGDGTTLIGLLAIGLAWALRLLLPLLHRVLRLESPGLQQFAASHWALGSLIAGLALLMLLSETGGLLWMGLLAIAGLYALFESRHSQSKLTSDFPWLDAAIIQLLCALGYGIHLLFYWPTLLGWAALVACPIAMALEVIPWERWGWNSRAGQRWAALVPGIVVLLTAWDIRIQALLLVAVFYAGIAQRRRQVRLGYVSLLLLDWAMLHILDQFQLHDILWYGGLLGANLLFLAQVDPKFDDKLQDQPARNLRHWLRCLGAATVCLSGLYQAEVGIAGLGSFASGLLAIALGLAFVAAGIGLRIRAFLYVGTITFVLRVLLQVWRFVQDESLFLWAIGILLGLLLIWIAATFEARRSQLTQLMNYWVTDLEEWD